jgi:soluble P-type ATPase
MIELAIPGRSTLCLTTAVLDFNGTLAFDGRLCEGVAERLAALSSRLALHVVTGDTTGTARQVLSALPVLVHIMPPDRQGAAKRAFLGGMDAAATAVIANGSNDREIVEYAALSIVVTGGEGCAVETLMRADIACARIDDALDLLLKPQRIIATLRR